MLTLMLPKVVCVFFLFFPLLRSCQGEKKPGNLSERKTMFLVNLEPETSVCKWLFQLDDEPNLYIKNGGFTKHPFKTGCLGFQE